MRVEEPKKWTKPRREMPAGTFLFGIGDGLHGNVGALEHEAETGAEDDLVRWLDCACWCVRGRMGWDGMT